MGSALLQPLSAERANAFSAGARKGRARCGWAQADMRAWSRRVETYISKSLFGGYVSCFLGFDAVICKVLIVVVGCFSPNRFIWGMVVDPPIMVDRK